MSDHEMIRDHHMEFWLLLDYDPRLGYNSESWQWSRLQRVSTRGYKQDPMLYVYHIYIPIHW